MTLFDDSHEISIPQLALREPEQKPHPPPAGRHAISRHDPLFLLAGPESRAVDLVDSAGSFHVDRLFKELGLKPAEIAAALKVRPQHVHAWCRAEPVRPRTPGAESLLMDFVRVATFLRALLKPSSPERAQTWIRQPLLPCRGRTPFELVCSGQGQSVVDILWEAWSGDSEM